MNIKKSTLLFSTLIALAGCQSHQAPTPPMAVQQSSLNLARLDVQITPPTNEDISAQWTSPSLSEQVSEWAHNRFIALGGSDIGRLTLKQVDLQHKLFPKDDSSVFQRSPAEEFILTLEVSFQVSGPTSNQHGSQAQSRTVQTSRLAEGSSKAERQAAVQALINRGLHDLDQALTKTISETMPLIVSQ